MIEETLRYIKKRADRSDFDWDGVWYGLDANIRNEKWVMDNVEVPKNGTATEGNL